jgi:uncharacterized protein with FMN-binding domain
MSKRGKIIAGIACVVLIFVVIGVSIYSSRLKAYRAKVDAIEIGEVDLAQVPDGIYRGGSDAVFVSAEVEVTVENHRIVDIRLQHKHGRGEEAEEIIDRVIEAQSLEVELITGATGSCKVILDAIKNSLKADR